MEYLMTLRTRERSKGLRQSSRRKEARENHQRRREGQRRLCQHHQYLIRKPLPLVRTNRTWTANISRRRAAHPINLRIMKGIEIVARLFSQGLRTSRHNQKTRDLSILLTPRSITMLNTVANPKMLKAALTQN